MADRLIRITTTLAMLAVAILAAATSYQHAYKLVRAHGETGPTPRLVPFTVNGPIWTASMVILDASPRNQAVPALAKWSLGVGIAATIGANAAHGLNHGPIRAVVITWPALALIGSFELLMTLTQAAASPVTPWPGQKITRTTSVHDQPTHTEVVRTPENAVLADHLASLNGPGSQRFLAEKHGIDRRKVKRIISTSAQPETV